MRTEEMTTDELLKESERLQDEVGRTVKLYALLDIERELSLRETS